MDTIKIGKFLKNLRKEKGITQEQLGEKIGVTNKTISRWETGNYMPPVECLTLLSDIYGVSINEIISGQRLSRDEFTDAAEENLSNALEISEGAYKETEKKLFVTLLISTILAITIIILIPLDKGHFLRGLIIIALVIGLAFISNTVNIVALVMLVMNKERYEKNGK